MLNTLLGWETMRCALKYFWQGSPLVVFHYRKSLAEMKAHYEKTWVLNSKNLTSRIQYFGPLPGMYEKREDPWNNCPNHAATRFGPVQHADPRRALAAVPDLKNAPHVCLPEGRVAGRPCRPYFAAVEVVVRREEFEHLRQFVVHHLTVGFGHVYIAVDDDMEAVREYTRAFQLFIDCNVVTIWTWPLGFKVPGRHVVQGDGHMHAGWKYGNSTFWMARLDADEFIVPLPPASSIVEFLLPLTGRHGEVPFQIMMGRIDFGDGGWKQKPPIEVPIVEAYVRSDAVPNSTKCMFQTDAFLLPPQLSKFDGNPHQAFNKEAVGTCQDAHWLAGWFLACWPQHKRIYKPPALRDNAAVPLRCPFAEALLQQVA